MDRTNTKCMVDGGNFQYHYFVIKNADGTLGLRARVYQLLQPKEAEKLLREGKFFLHCDEPDDKNIEVIAYGNMFAGRKDIEVYRPMDIHGNKHPSVTSEDVANLLREQFKEANGFRYYLY